MDDILLKVEDISLKRNGRYILRQVNLSVRRGEIHGILGLNGAGKSSLAYTIMGCADYVPDEGRILFEGNDITHLSITERARLGITLAWQEPARFEGLRVSTYLSLGMKEPDRTRIMEALEAVALPPSAYMHRFVDNTLSGGERKRIELAAVYAMRPKLAILDEPDSGVDILSLDDVLKLIKGMASNGTTVLLITHRDEALEIADSASLMCQGTILYRGNVEQVRQYYAQRCKLHPEMLKSPG
ncbi:MAG: ABC transporter ATP-binding protein [Armatimonadetes bacterium]|nr:ABC transporter ATP-binding protein [Armatimonadota bacterium]